MNLGVIGSRTFSDYDLLKTELNKFKDITKIISGGAKGADILSEKYAQEFGIETVIFYPEYEKHGRKAPFLRNTSIVQASDIVIAFWDEVSKGTKDSINKCTKLNKQYKIILYNSQSL